MNQKFLALKTWIAAHKKTSIAIALVVIAIGFYSVKAATSTTGETRYVTALAKKGSVIATLTGSGQVSASDQIDIKSKVSGDIVSLSAKAGDVLHAGDVVARIDSHDAQVALQNAELSYQKLTEPTDTLSLLQAQNAITAAKEDNQRAQDDLEKAYEEGFNDVASTFLDLPGIVSDLDDLFYSLGGALNADSIKNINDTAIEYQQMAAVKFDATKIVYDSNFAIYKKLDRTSSKSQIESLIASTYETTRELAETIKDSKDTMDYIKSLGGSSNASISSALTSSNTWTSTINSHISALLAAKTAIENAKTTITSSERQINEKNQSLAKLQSGADSIDIQSELLSLKEKQNALADYTIRAPFDGVVAKVDVTSHDSVSNSTAIATFVTKEKIATISLNEVDAAKVAVGQKVTLKFDAIDGLSIAGTVSEVDLVGTVTQGVVNYTVKILFDTQDDRIKPGMSVSASIVTEMKQDVLTVPNSAVKSDMSGSYVEVFDPPLTATAGILGTASTTLPAQVAVTTGLTDDTMTEILSGLTEGQQVVTRTIAPTTTAAASSSPSLLGGTRTTTGTGTAAFRAR